VTPSEIWAIHDFLFTATAFSIVASMSIVQTIPMSLDIPATIDVPVTTINAANSTTTVVFSEIVVDLVLDPPKSSFLEEQIFLCLVDDE